ncbi:MAG: methylated-DNA--[protein]-cysteine S-methyltransferase [Rhizomicrobium sp.]
MPKPSETLFRDRVATPIGELLLVADGQARLRLLEFSDQPERWRWQFERRFAGALFEDACDPFGLSAVLARYFDGDIAALDAVMAEGEGTEFQRTCWSALRRIPAGMTTTYGAMARMLGRPAAMRAVGLANAANPIAVVVPCHRLIGSGGSLTGYGGGLARKRWLLDHEARNAGRCRSRLA